MKFMTALIIRQFKENDCDKNREGNPKLREKKAQMHHQMRKYFTDNYKPNVCN